MNSTTIRPDQDTAAVTTKDIERGLQQGRHLRAQAFGDALKSLFTFGGLFERSKPATESRRELHDRDCAAAT